MKQIVPYLVTAAVCLVTMTLVLRFAPAKLRQVVTG